MYSYLPPMWAPLTLCFPYAISVWDISLSSWVKSSLDHLGPHQGILHISSMVLHWFSQLNSAAMVSVFNYIQRKGSIFSLSGSPELFNLLCIVGGMYLLTYSENQDNSW